MKSPHIPKYIITSRVSVRVIYVALLMLVTCVALFVANMLYTNKVAEENNRAWCEVLDLIHEGNKTDPPTTDNGRKFAQVIANLRNRYGCI